MTYQPGGPVPVGWYWDGQREVHNAGTGWFFTEGQWFWRPDLVSAPPAMTWQDHVRVEAQRLSTPWPKYGEAWRHAKAGGWLCRRYLQIAPLLVPWFIYGVITTDPQIRNEPFTSSFLIAILMALTPVIAFWRIYHRHLGTVDKHKQIAFSVATYAATALGAHMLAERSERPPSSTFRTPDQIGRGVFPR